MFDDDDVTDVSASNTDATDELTLIDDEDVILMEADELAMLRMFGVLD